MADIIALDVSMGKSNVAWYHQKNCRGEFVFRHTQSGFNQLLSTVLTQLFSLKLLEYIQAR